MICGSKYDTKKRLESSPMGGRLAKAGAQMETNHATYHSHVRVGEVSRVVKKKRSWMRTSEMLK